MLRLTKLDMFAIEMAQAILRQVPEAIDLSAPWESLNIGKVRGGLYDRTALAFQLRGVEGRFTALCFTPVEMVEARGDCRVVYRSFIWDYYGYLEANKLRLLNNHGDLGQIGLSSDVTEPLAAAGITQLKQLRSAGERDLCCYLCPGNRGDHLGFPFSTRTVDDLTWARLEDVRIALAKVGLGLPEPRLTFAEMQQLL